MEDNMTPLDYELQMALEKLPDMRWVLGYALIFILSPTVIVFIIRGDTGAMFLKTWIMIICCLPPFGLFLAPFGIVDFLSEFRWQLRNRS